jgi:hypothetical protein
MEDYRPSHKHRKPDNEIALEAKRTKELELKERISKALKKSDEAMERYRKLSIHSISTEFGKRNI